MSGRGKGGKGLGKGDAKRHRKVLRDNIQGITKPAIRRLARTGGLKRISGLIYEETRGVLKIFLENVIRDAVTYTEHARRKTVTAMDTYPNPLQDNTAYSVVKQYFVNPDDTVCQKVYFEPDEVHACIVTCGGLCPGLNTVIREIVCGLSDMYGVTKILGIQGGYRGFYARNTIDLTPKSVNDIHKRGGTILGSSRGGHDTMKIVASIPYRGINQVYVIGGDGSQRGAGVIFQEIRKHGLKVAVAGIPKTIDNDIPVILCSRRMPLRDDGTLKGGGVVHALPVSLLRGRRGVAVQNGAGGGAAEGQGVPGGGDRSPRRSSLEAPVAWSDGSTSGAASSFAKCLTKIPRSMTCLPLAARDNCASYAYHKRFSSPVRDITISPSKDYIIWSETLKDQLSDVKRLNSRVSADKTVLGRPYFHADHFRHEEKGTWRGRDAQPWIHGTYPTRWNLFGQADAVALLHHGIDRVRRGVALPAHPLDPDIPIGLAAYPQIQEIRRVWSKIGEGNERLGGATADDNDPRSAGYKQKPWMP
ncbi:ATP-dependent 6-phosphofructokinase 7-like [Hordeum vulgare]|nr:ATP-dependent 6-phosphofructokinase 7-like [Hordeum vulgare]